PEARVPQRLDKNTEGLEIHRVAVDAAAHDIVGVRPARVHHAARPCRRGDRMMRRKFITLLGGTAAARPVAAPVRQRDTVARTGHLDLGPASARASRVEALRAGLRDLDYAEGKYIIIEFRWADGVQQLPELAAQ